jgi:type IV pilus assembly protein PilW
MPANPGLVIAVRLAVLTRANLIEAKDKTTGLCNATPATSPELQWAGGTFDVTGTVDWDCYRYKKFEMVVPLRNIIWMPS